MGRVRIQIDGKRRNLPSFRVFFFFFFLFFFLLGLFDHRHTLVWSNTLFYTTTRQLLFIFITVLFCLPIRLLVTHFIFSVVTNNNNKEHDKGSSTAFPFDHDEDHQSSRLGLGLRLGRCRRLALQAQAASLIYIVAYRRVAVVGLVYRSFLFRRLG